ncbi:YchJ family protein [Agromyces sp. MMS24-JH15]|uniref:YchJ family protein n=1 Tax=Agromyces sp. MMS24-JH15 TaxID=3243765 RepID=UPI0037487E62
MTDAPTAFPTPSDADRCPCGSGDAFGACCSPFLRGIGAPPTAVQTMRSRYTAYVVGDRAHLLATWHPSTRPAELDLDPALEWRSLSILRTERGGPFDADGVVEFVAAWREGGDRGRLHETSRFRREGGRWTYVDGDLAR